MWLRGQVAPRDEEIPAEKLTFLQRSLTLNDDGVLTWRLPKQTIEDMIHWVRKKDYSNPIVLRSSARNMLLEARRYGIAYFTEIYNTLLRAFEDAQIPLDLPSDPESYCVSRL